MASKETKKAPAPEQWQPIKERSKTPDPSSEQETRFYFALMHKNNHRHVVSDFTVYPSIISTPIFVDYSFRNTIFLGFFIRDLMLCQPEIFKQYKTTIKTSFVLSRLIKIVRSGKVPPHEWRTKPASTSLFNGVSFFLGFPSVNCFCFFLESLYSLPYDKMMKGEGVKRGQPWYALNYEEGTSQQGPNDDQEPPI